MLKSQKLSHQELSQLNDPIHDPDTVAAIERLARNLEILGAKISQDAKPALTAAAAAGVLTVILRKAIKAQPIGSLLVITMLGYKVAGHRTRTAPNGPDSTVNQQNPLVAGLGKAVFHVILDGLTAMSLADRFKPHN